MFDQREPGPADDAVREILKKYTAKEIFEAICMVAGEDEPFMDDQGRVRNDYWEVVARAANLAWNHVHESGYEESGYE